MPKPSDLFISVVGFFAVLVPGAVVAFFAAVGPAVRNASLEHVSQTYGSRLIAAVSDPAGLSGSLALLLVAYVAGQVLYAVGSWILDPIYEMTYKLWKLRSKSDPASVITPIRRRLSPDFPSGDYPWARAYLWVTNQTAADQIERLDADSKFFRSLVIVVLVAPVELKGLDHWQGAFWAISASVAIAGAAVFAITRRKSSGTRAGQHPAEARPLDEPSNDKKWRDTAKEAWSRGWLLAIGVLGLITSSILVAEPDRPTSSGAMLTAVTIVVILVAFLLRFNQQRWQRNETAYEVVSLLDADRRQQYPHGRH